MFYPRTQAGKGGPGLEVWRHREIQGISWDLALLGEVQEGSGESEGSDTRRRSLRKNIPCRGIALLMALGPRSHQARACFDIPHGEELDRSSCCEPLSGWLPESGSERTRGSLQKVRGSREGEEGIRRRRGRKKGERERGEGAGDVREEEREGVS